MQLSGKHVTGWEVALDGFIDHEHSLPGHEPDWAVVLFGSLAVVQPRNCPCKSFRLLAKVSASCPLQPKKAPTCGANLTQDERS